MNQPFDIESRIRSAAPIGTMPVSPATTNSGGPGFSKVLQEQSLAAATAQAGIKISGHAQTRLASRQITLTGEDVAKVGLAMTRAAAKGSKDSLFLMDKTALVVSIANRTVITAVSRESLKENIFTNIDSAMFL